MFFSQKCGYLFVKERMILYTATQRVLIHVDRCVSKQAAYQAMLLGLGWQLLIIPPTSPSGRGGYRRNFDVQVIFCPLTPFGIIVDCCPLSKLSLVALTILLNSDSSGVGVALARTRLVFDVVYTELRCRGPLSWLHSNSLVEVSALARPDSVIVYFVSL